MVLKVPAKKGTLTAKRTQKPKPAASGGSIRFPSLLRKAKEIRKLQFWLNPPEQDKEAVKWANWKKAVGINFFKEVVYPTIEEMSRKVAKRPLKKQVLAKRPLKKSKA